MYPTVVIVLIETQRRPMTDICPSNANRFTSLVASEARPATLRQLSFAVGPIHSRTDNEAESQRSRASHRQGGQEHGLEKIIIEVEESGNQVGTSS